MDKRIIRTKRLLRRSLLDLISREPFEKITVTKICTNAGTGRGTFYTYYSDKSALLIDCFIEMRELTKNRFQQMQRQNNEANDLMVSTQNLIEAILLTSGRNSGKHNMLLANGEILTQYYNYITDILVYFEDENADIISTNYERDNINAFLSLGIWGFMNVYGDSGTEKTKQETYKLIGDLLDSRIFIRKERPADN